MAGEDPAYLDRVRKLPCCAPQKLQFLRCRSTSEAHHHRHKGAGGGQRAHDHDAMPLCMRHHTDFHQLSGPFRGLNRRQLTEWQDAKVSETQRCLGLRTPYADPDGFVQAEVVSEPIGGMPDERSLMDLLRANQVRGAYEPAMSQEEMNRRAGFGGLARGATAQDFAELSGLLGLYDALDADDDDAF